MTKTPPSHEGPAGPAVVPALSSHGVDRVRRRRRRALWGAVGGVVVLALLLGLGGWLWWLRSGMAGASQPTASAPPPLTSTSLPSGVEKGDLVSLGGSIRPKRTDKGTLESAGMHVEQNQWVGSVRWRPKGGEAVKYEMHLGESVHIDGLGTVTLVAVTPPSTSPPDKSKTGGARERVHVNVNLDPGIQWCRPSDSC